VTKFDEKRIAERYVKALFEVAQETAAIAAVERDLNALGELLMQSDDFQHFLVNPLLSAQAKSEAMITILAKMGAHPLTDQFVGMLIRGKRLAILPEVITLFGEWASDARGELRGEVIAATTMKSKEIEAVGQRLGKAYGKTMKLQVRQDPALLGGVVVKIGSLELDGSLAGKMRRLKIALQAA